MHLPAATDCVVPRDEVPERGRSSLCLRRSVRGGPECPGYHEARSPKPELEHLRPRKRHHAVSIAARDDDFLVRGIERNTRRRDARDLLNRDLPARRNIPFAADAPCADGPPAPPANDEPLIVAGSR